MANTKEIRKIALEIRIGGLNEEVTNLWLGIVVWTKVSVVEIKDSDLFLVRDSEEMGERDLFQGSKGECEKFVRRCIELKAKENTELEAEQEMAPEQIKNMANARIDELKEIASNLRFLAGDSKVLGEELKTLWTCIEESEKKAGELERNSSLILQIEYQSPPEGLLEGSEAAETSVESDDGAVSEDSQLDDEHLSRVETHEMHAGAGAGHSG